MKVLLAMDDSAASSIALEEVASRPWPKDCSIEVLTVVEPSYLWTDAEAVANAVQVAEEAVQGAVDLIRAKGLAANGVVLEGSPRTVILDWAKENHPDWIIVGSHGASAVHRFVLGSVAAAILRHAPCSCAIMRAPAGEEGRTGKKVLLATDGSEFSETAARSIAERAWPAGTEVCVLSAVELVLPSTRALLQPPFINSAYFEEARASAMQRAQDAVAHARQILSSTDLEVSESISILIDPPKTVILQEAARWNADLIVVGSHGRSGVDRLFLGSVSEAVAIQAHCSVEVIRAKTT